MEIQRNSTEVENISRWLKANPINTNSALSEYEKRLSQMQEIMKKVNEAIDVSMRQQQLVLEINKRIETYKNNTEIYQYLNQLKNRLQNLNEVNNVQRSISELENCYEKKQIVMKKLYIK